MRASLLTRLARGETLTEAEAEAVFADIAAGQVTSIEVAAILMAMRLRGETVDEVIGAVRALRRCMIPIASPPDTIDVCGTGGDQQHTLNVSTAVAFVLAGLGLPVAKHGNRAVSSRSGAADVIAALGIGSGQSGDAQAARLARTGLVFLHAPLHHAALHHVAEARAALGTRTIFNLLGPLLNPAQVRRQLVGVFDPTWTSKLALALGRTGSDRVWVVHGNGTDELTLAGETLVAEWRDGDLRQFTVTPEQAGLTRAPIAALRGGDPAHNAAALERLLRGQAGAYRETVLLNVAASLVIADRARDLRDGVSQAAAAIDDGRALAALTTQRDDARKGRD